MVKSQSDKDDWTRAIHHELNIKRRTCTTFIPKTPTSIDPGRSRSDIKCGCNRLKREHSWNAFDGNESEWNQKIHTTAAYNNAYGFIPRNDRNEAKYIRCDIQTDPEILAKLMFNVWKVKAPRLIMCIIGGAKYFKLSERLEREFMKGIIQVALKAKGWIVTTGFKTGVVQLVGEAIHDHRVTNPDSPITAVGCSKWGATIKRESLTLTKTSTKPNVDPLVDPTKNEKGQQDLEPNHTHFLLLDDGTYYGYDIGDYRTKFVIAASHHDKKHVPIVTLVVEGGPDTLTTIATDLRNDIPVVLIDGSGRVPNLLANFLTRTEAMINRKGKSGDNIGWKDVFDDKDINDIENLKTKFHAYTDEIRDGIREITKGSNTSDKKMNELFNSFLYCLQPALRSKIHIYSLDGDHNLADTIFEAIIEAKLQSSSVTDKTATRVQLLELALAWDAIAIAKEHIIKDDLNDLKTEDKKILFLEALKCDSPQFVNTFIKLNFDVSSMFYEGETNKPWKLKWEPLADLYTFKEDNKRKERLYLLDNFNDHQTIDSPQKLDYVLRKLVGDYMKSIYTRVPSGFAGKLKICCSQGSRVANSEATLYRGYDGDDSEAPDPEESKKEAEQLVFRDLFFWSILTNRIEMSKVLLSHMQTRICGALIASKVLKSYIRYASDNESKETLQSEADQFEEYANRSLKFCYNFNEELACEIAIRRINLFGGVSCLQVAVDADDKLFVGQPCCDQLLNNIWYDKMDPYHSTLPKRLGLLASICTFGLLAPFCVTFREEQSKQNNNNDNTKKRDYEFSVNETEEETEELLSVISTKKLNNYGINYSDTYKSRLDCCPKGCSTYFRRLKYFHQSPFIKYTYSCISYIFFLLLFSYYLLFDFNVPTDDIPSIHWTEILVIIIVSTMLIEDIRQFLCQDNRSILGKLRNYFVVNVFYSSIRIASYLLFYIGLILRFTYASDELELSVAKIILAYDLEIWFIRSLTFLGAVRKMGPKLVMIRRMLIDLSFFIYIILIAMIGYGVASRAMYNYNDDTDTDDLIFSGRSIFRHIVYPVYYLMYGSQDNELQSLDRNPEAGTAIATQVLLAFHMLFVNILLINLLIAMFSYTFESVQTQTDLVWRYERYALIREYFHRPPLFPPFIIITHFIELLKLILRHSMREKNPNTKQRRAKTFKMIGANRNIDKEWSEFESYATNLFARKIVSGQPSTSTALTPSIPHQDTTQTTTDIYNISQLQTNFDVKAITDEMTSLKRAVGDLRTYAEEMNRCMQWMMDAMERVKMSKEPRPRIRSTATTDGLKQIDE